MRIDDKGLNLPDGTLFWRFRQSRGEIPVLFPHNLLIRHLQIFMQIAAIMIKIMNIKIQFRAIVQYFRIDTCPSGRLLKLMKRGEKSAQYEHIAQIFPHISEDHLRNTPPLPGIIVHGSEINGPEPDPKTPFGNIRLV